MKTLSILSIFGSILHRVMSIASFKNTAKFRFWNPVTTIISFMIVSLFVSTCGLKPNKDRLQYEISELEIEVSTLYRDTGKSEATIAQSVVLRDAYLTYAHSWSTDSLTAEYLFQAAMIDADIQNDVSNSIKYLERIVGDFPDHPIRSKTLFLVGFTYAEQLHDFTKAQKAYQQYLDEYPEGEMASSVRIEIETLGLAPFIPIIPDNTATNSSEPSEQP